MKNSIMKKSFISGAAALALSSSLYAATHTVTTLNDEFDNNCTDTASLSLRDAIYCSSNGDTVDFGVTGGSLSVASSALIVDKNISILGPGYQNLNFVSTYNTLFSIPVGADVNISGLTINGVNDAPAINNIGNLTLSDCNISNNSNYNSCAGDAAGITNTGSLTIVNSNISNNNSSGSFGGAIANQSGSVMSITESNITGNYSYRAGAIYNDASSLYINGSIFDSNYVTGSSEGGGAIYNNTGTLTIEKTTFEKNSAVAGGAIFSISTMGIKSSSFIENNVTGDGGAIYISAGGTNIINTTISANHTDGSGGGIYVMAGDVNISHSTIAFNASGTFALTASGGGIYNSAGNVNIKNTIIANNFDSYNHGPDLYGLITSYGYNLITTDQDANITLQTSDINGSGPLLKPMAFNGMTYSYPLQSFSPAIDSGVCTDIYGFTVEFDQNYITRPIGSACDIGAVEQSIITFNHILSKDFAYVGSMDMTSGTFTDVDIAFDSSASPYIVTEASPAEVRMFNGTDWVSVDGLSASYAYDPDIEFGAEGTPYIGYYDSSTNAATVKYYDGQSWVLYDSFAGDAGGYSYTDLDIGPNGLFFAYISNTDSNISVFKEGDGMVELAFASPMTAASLSMAVSLDGTPYIIFYNDVSSQAEIKVMKHNGSIWEQVGATMTSDYLDQQKMGIEVDSTGAPYIIYREYDPITYQHSLAVKCFNGSSWEYVGGSAISANTWFDYWLKLDANDVPYVAYHETDIVVVKFDGAAWQEVARKTTGDYGNYAYFAMELDPQGVPYIVYRDGGIGQGSVKKVIEYLPLSIQEGSTIVSTIDAESNSGGSITYTISGGTDSGLFVINPSTGVLEFASAPLYDIYSDNIYDVIVRAEDVNGGAAELNVAVSVEHIPETLAVATLLDDVTGSLRDVVLNAAPGDTIDLSGLTGTINLTGPLYFTDKKLIIQGPGADHLIISGNGSYTVFETGDTTTLKLIGLTIENGYSYDMAGGINNAGVLEIESCIIRNNQGNGIYNWSSGKMSILQSSVYDNNATYSGGGIANDGSIKITNSTISANHTDGSGGGVYNDGDLNISHSTIAWNHSEGVTSGGPSSGGGIYNNNTGTVNLLGTIIANNSDTDNHGPDLFGAITSLGYNLIATDQDANITHQLPATDINGTDPLLDTLFFNGETYSHTLQSFSPAIDSGICTDLNGQIVGYDQNGTVRPQGSTCDIGAIESVIQVIINPSVAVTPLAIAFGDIPIGGYAEKNITIENNSTADLTVNGITLQTVDTIAYIDDSNCSAGTILASAGSCSVTVSVSPTATGAYANSAIIDTDSSDGNVSVPITANGTAYIPSDCTTDASLCYDYSECTSMGWDMATCESYFPTYDYPGMYTDPTSCESAGYYWDGMYCTDTSSASGYATGTFTFPSALSDYTDIEIFAVETDSTGSDDYGWNYYWHYANAGESFFSFSAPLYNSSGYYKIGYRVYSDNYPSGYLRQGFVGASGMIWSFKDAKVFSFAELQTALNMNMTTGLTITGTVSLPANTTISSDMNIQLYTWMETNSSDGTPFYAGPYDYYDDWRSVVIPAGSPSAAYTLTVPDSSYGHRVHYWIDDENGALFPTIFNYGMYSTNGTTPYYEDASLVYMSGADKPNIDMTMLKANLVTGTLSKPSGYTDYYFDTNINFYSNVDNRGFGGQWIYIGSGADQTQYTLKVPTMVSDYKVSYDFYNYMYDYNTSDILPIVSRGYYSTSGTTAYLQQATALTNNGSKAGINLSLIEGAIITASLTVDQTIDYYDYHMFVENNQLGRLSNWYYWYDVTDMFVVVPNDLTDFRIGYEAYGYDGKAMAYIAADGTTVTDYLSAKVFATLSDVGNIAFTAVETTQPQQQEDYVHIEFGMRVTDTEYLNAAALDPSVLFGRSFYMLRLDRDKVETERFDIQSNQWSISEFNPQTLQYEMTEQIAGSVSNNIIDVAIADIKYLGSVDASSYNSVDFNIFSASGKAYEFIFKRKIAEYEFWELEKEWSTGAIYTTIDQFIMAQSGSRTFMSDENGTYGFAFNTTSYTSGDTAGVLNLVDTYNWIVTDNAAGTWEIKYVADLGDGTGGDVLVVTPNAEYNYERIPAWTVKSDGYLWRGEYMPVGEVFKFILFDATAHNEFSDYVSLNYGIPVPASVTDLYDDSALRVQLNSGWNLLSLPAKAYLNQSDLSSIFGSKTGKIDYLAKYDPIGWSYYFVDKYDDTVSRFTSISSNEGFWLKVSSQFELVYPITEESAYANEARALTSGWNLVGFNSDKTPQEVKSLYLGYSIESIWAYKNGTWSIYVPDAEKDALVSATIPRINSISRFDGVWINVK